ncbi:DUF883 family protein [Pseudomonas mangiferae]|uniref:DUF883 domain-containing protein n=1 Tax=Pseudomonas mangiferae TaxID=2593654 RepID=A0A553H209_9PSED|nr:DUF883 family protein [Pseudomonas mangiferae]TRX75790.1 DUF883 domain-containing protein [Pseudomonas mangiferae]
MANTPSVENQKKQDELVVEFQTLVRDTEKLLESTADLAGEHADELRQQVTQNLDRAREALRTVEETVRERSKQAIQTTEEYVQTNPWQAIGVAAGVGFVLGLLTARR